MKDDIVYVQHILDAIDHIQKYTKDQDNESFLENELLQDGVIRQLEILGEATKRISEKFRNDHPNIPFRSMAGMRDKLAHDYLGVDLEAVWATIMTDIPDIKLKFESIFPDL